MIYLRLFIGFLRFSGIHLLLPLTPPLYTISPENETTLGMGGERRLGLTRVGFLQLGVGKTRETR
jgi:hypothetical protein